MNKSLSWKSTSLQIDTSLAEGTKLVRIFKDIGLTLRKDETKYILENKEDFFVFEDDFISQSKNLSSIIRKYSKKQYAEQIKVYKENLKSFENVQVNTKDQKIYKTLTEGNNIKGNVQEFPISVNALNTVLNNRNSRSVLFVDILILMALANKSTFNAESIKSQFRIEEQYYNVDLHILESEPINLYSLYDWIVNDEEYEESYNVKLQIVRQVIINKKDIRDVNTIIEDSKLAYKRIISKKTNEYFEQLNQLKDDFLILSRNENSVLRTLHLTFFAWLGSLGIQLFELIVDYTGEDILQYVFSSSGAKKGIIVLMFIIALIFVFVSYVLEIKALENSYDVIKKIYKDKILFENDSEKENKFENTIKKPQVGKLQTGVFAVIIIILMIRLYKTFPW